MAKKTNSRNFEKEFLERRLETLQKFLTAVCEHEELKSSIYFSAFIKFDDHAQFQKMREEFDKAYSVTSSLKENYSRKLFEGSRPVKLSDFKTKDGVVRSRITKDLREFAIQSEELQKNCQPAYDRLKDLCREFMDDIDKVSETIIRICDQANYLRDLHKKFNDNVKEGKWELMHRMYEIMSGSLSRWGVLLKKNSQMMNEHLVKTFKYSKKEYDSMLDLIKTRNQAGQEYYKTSQVLEAHKEKLLQSPDPHNWGINFEQVKMTPEEVAKNKIVAKSLMLPAQNQIMNEMKNIFGYFNHTMVKELSYMGNSRAKRYIRSLNNFCSEQIDCLEGQTTLFNNLKNSLIEVYELLPECRSPETSGGLAPPTLTVPPDQSSNRQAVPVSQNTTAGFKVV